MRRWLMTHTGNLSRTGWWGWAAAGSGVKSMLCALSADSESVITKSTVPGADLGELKRMAGWRAGQWRVLARDSYTPTTMILPIIGMSRRFTW